MKSISNYMLNSLEKRESNKYTGPSCSIVLYQDYIYYLNECLEEADPKAEQATKNSIEMFFKSKE